MHGRCVPVSAESHNTLYSQILANCSHYQAHIIGDAPGAANNVIGVSPLGPRDDSSDHYAPSNTHFGRIPEMLVAVSHSRPLVIILDDLHYVDAPSLDLLSYLAQTLTDLPVCIVAAYRPWEIQKRASGDKLEIIKRRALNLEVRSLSSEAMRQLLGERMIRIDEEQLEQLRKLTGGNPKLILEYERVIAQDGAATTLKEIVAVSPGISIAINERIEGLPLFDRHLLACASIIGSTFERELAIEIAEIDRQEAIKAFGQFEVRGLIRPLRPGEFEFTPNLLREVIYREIPPDIRASLHRRAGSILKELAGQRGADSAEHIARHLHHSREPDAVEEALENANRAGRQFLLYGNYAKASEMFALALDTARRFNLEEQGRLCDQLTEYGAALNEMGDLAGAEELFREAVACAEKMGEPQRICELALKVPDYHWPLPGCSSALAILLCERALKLTDNNPGLQARLAGRLAAELSYDPSQKARAAALIALSMQIIGNGEEDRALALQVMRYRDCTLRHPDQLEDRLSNAEEMSRLARETGDHVSLWEAATARIVSLLALGRSNESEREFQIIEQTTKMIRRPIYQVFHLFTLASRAAFFGRFDDCKRLFWRGRHAAIEGKVSGVLAQCWPLLIIPYFEDERLLELESIANDDWASRYSRSFAEQAVRCWLNACLGRHFEAKMQLQHLAIDNFADLRSSAELLSGAVMLAAACLRIGNMPQYAASLYDLLLPYADRNAVFGQVAYLGSISFYLGRLANALSRTEDAIGHFQAAMQRHSEMEARSWNLYAACELADILLKAENRERSQYGAALVSQIKVEAESRGMGSLAKRVAGISTGDPNTSTKLANDRSMIGDQRLVGVNSGTADAPTGVFRKIGRFWTLTHNGQTAQVKHRKGLSLISVLISKPHESIHVATLGGAMSEAQNSSDDPLEGFEPSDIGAMIDREAKRSYEARARDLRLELNEAKLHNDLGRVEKLEQELRFLMRELARAVGLYGRDRLSGSSNERARLRVTNAIRSAISEISVHHPALAQHLTMSIKTGLFCSYSPPANSSVDWEV